MWRGLLFVETSLTLDPLFLKNGKNLLDWNTFNRALDNLWYNSATEMPSLVAFANLGSTRPT